MDGLRWGEAAAALDPADPAAAELQGEIETRTGAYAEAIASYRAAAARGDTRAAARADALADALAVEASLTTADEAAVVRAAVFWAGEGAPGKALGLLELASPRIQGEPGIASRIAELRRFYGLD